MRPVKHLGQNFLTSKRIVEDIVRAADLQPDDVVLEVGPGKGILTEAILEKIPDGKLIAVEKDKQLVEFLQEKFSGNKNLKIIHNDVLKIDICKLIENCKLKIENYKIVANIPYYITSRFLRKFLEGDPSTSLGASQPSKMVLMVQKEVAERIVGEGSSFVQQRMILRHKESILSISVKAYGQPKIIKKVPAKYFSPRPKVDSAILLINNISKNFFRGIDEKKFFSLVKQGFSQKRKLLKNNLSLSKTELLTRCGVAEKARAEDLSLEDWKCLVKYDIIK